jgi:single-strand DNA-binding protein
MVNKVILLGNLGKDPESKTLTSGQIVCNFSIATTEKWTDQGGQKQEKTEWHRIVVWAKLAENCAKYLTKGQKVYIEGKLTTRSWDDKNGQKQHMTEIVAAQVVFLGGGKGNAAPAAGDDDDCPL